MITKETIMEAYLFMRKESQSVPSETLEFMKDTALAELQKCKVKNLGIHGVSKPKGTFVPDDVKLPKEPRPISVNTQSGKPVTFRHK